jgi:hypothetical protein
VSLEIATALDRNIHQLFRCSLTRPRCRRRMSCQKD